MGEYTKWVVEFYRDVQGRVPVQEFLEELAKRDRAQMLRVISLLAEFGIQLGLPHARPVAQGLWELRAGAGRVFYVAQSGRRLILLHGYRKKSQKAPRREIETALRRWDDLREREE